MHILHRNLIALYLVLTLASVLHVCDAEARQEMEKPDLTAGEPIPKGATHDWNLGATGARGWIYSENLTTSKARQIAVTEVAEGSPADSALKVGDVILGVMGQPFSYDPRTEFGKALTLAETPQGAGDLGLSIWREGRTQEVLIKLPVLGQYSATAPYDCAKSRLIYQRGCEALAERMARPDYKANAIPRALNALALLASGEEKHLPLLKKEAEWASQLKQTGLYSWSYGYVTIFLAEYAMITNDPAAKAGLERLALEIAEGQSTVGSWGHHFAKEDGRLGGYGMMQATGLPLTMALVLARKAGINHPAIHRAIDRGASMARFYAGKGAVPYGDHLPWVTSHELNGKSGMAGVLFSLLDEPKSSKFFSRMSLAAHGAERDYGHSGNFWNVLWSMPGVNLGGPDATGAWMQEYGAWYFDLARRWDDSFLHQGPPQMRGDKTDGWDASGAFLLAYAMPLKTLVLTGRNGIHSPQMDHHIAQALIDDGKGWTRHDGTSFYDSLSEEALFKRLDSWSPIVRERAAKALARRETAPIDLLIQKLGSGRLESRLGACQALIQLGPESAPALTELRTALGAKNLWLRVKAAEAITMMGNAGLPVLPELLERIAIGPTLEDPRGMEQRFLILAVFDKFIKSANLKTIDKDLLRKAIVAGLQNEDGRTRGAVGGIYAQLPFEDLEPVLPAIHEAIVTPAPSGKMFDDNIRISGLHFMADNQIEAGIPLCLDLMELEGWGDFKRIPRGLDVLEKYGEAVRPHLPRLRALEKSLSAKPKLNKKRQQLIDRLRKLITELAASS